MSISSAVLTPLLAIAIGSLPKSSKEQIYLVADSLLESILIFDMD